MAEYKPTKHRLIASFQTHTNRSQSSFLIKDTLRTNETMKYESNTDSNEV
jgi:hypothetical protein